MIEQTTFDVRNDIRTDLIKQCVSGGILAVLLLLASVGCDSETKNNSTTKKNHPSLAVLRQNIRAAENENLDAYMDTIHPEAPIYDRTRTTMKRMIGTYDLTYELSELNVTEQTEDKVHVEFVQVTKKKSGPKFRPNRIHGVHILKMHDGEWKLWNTKQQEIKYLD